MSAGDQQGALVLTIDLELDLDHCDGQRQRRLDEVRSQLVAMTRDAGIAATWAVADPMLSAASESILSARVGHEIAVLGDQAWLGPGCGRARLERELTRRFCVPRKAGMAINTLVLRNVEQVVDLDLLLDHDVKAMCRPAVEQLRAARRLGQPPIRFGLWQPPVAWTLPPMTTWWSPTAWQVRREIKRAIRRKSLLHLRLDALQLVDSPDVAQRGLVGMFHYVATKRERGQLAVATIGSLAVAALENRAASPSRSILRPAA